MSGGSVQQKARSQLSDNGKLRLNVNFRSTVDPQSGEESRWKQPVFSLEEVETGKTWWVREGNWRNERGIELFVSDEGWSVIRVRFRVPRLLVVTPEGIDTLSVEICRPTKRKNEEPPAQAGKWERWTDEHVQSILEVGIVWTDGARFRFARAGLQTFFVCRTGWGRYLVLDLSAARVVSEAEAPPELSAQLRPADQQWALEILGKVCRHRAELESAIENADGVVLSPDSMNELYDDLEIALQIVRQDRVRAAAEYLRDLEDFTGPLYSDKILVEPEKGHVECHSHQVRKWNHLAMMAAGIQPKGRAILEFCHAQEGIKTSFLRLPECVADRWQKLMALKPGLRACDITGLVGAPEAILEPWYLGDSIVIEEGFNYERWDYDELGTDGKPVSWGLLWRVPKSQSTREGDATVCNDPSLFKTAPECTPQLVSVTRFEWTKPYRRMREEDHPM